MNLRIEDSPTSQKDLREAWRWVAHATANPRATPLVSGPDPTDDFVAAVRSLAAFARMLGVDESADLVAAVRDLHARHWRRWPAWAYDRIAAAADRYPTPPCCLRVGMQLAIMGRHPRSRDHHVEPVIVMVIGFNADGTVTANGATTDDGWTWRDDTTAREVEPTHRLEVRAGDIQATARWLNPGPAPNWAHIELPAMPVRPRPDPVAAALTRVEALGLVAVRLFHRRTPVRPAALPAGTSVTAVSAVVVGDRAGTHTAVRVDPSSTWRRVGEQELHLVGAAVPDPPGWLHVGNVIVRGGTVRVTGDGSDDHIDMTAEGPFHRVLVARAPTPVGPYVPSDGAADLDVVTDWTAAPAAHRWLRDQAGRAGTTVTLEPEPSYRTRTVAVRLDPCPTERAVELADRDPAASTAAAADSTLERWCGPHVHGARAGVFAASTGILADDAASSACSAAANWNGRLVSAQLARQAAAVAVAIAVMHVTTGTPTVTDLTRLADMAARHRGDVRLDRIAAIVNTAMELLGAGRRSPD